MSTNQIRLIINADDLGMSSQVNDAIFGLMASRRVSSATVMANGPALREVIGQLQRFPSCSFGVHLNLTQFEPINGGPSARMLVNHAGQLSRDIEHASPSLPLLRAIYEELCAQVERLRSLGVPISHFDSHNHIHTRPFMFPVLKAVQRRCRVRKVRVAKNLYSPDAPCASRSLYLKKRAYNWALRNIYRTQTTEGFTELLSFCRLGQPARLVYESVELMVHPGAPYAEEETATLKTDWLQHLALSAEIINYGQLSAG